MVDLNLFEVMVIPRDLQIQRDVDMRFNTFAPSATTAIDKVKRYLTERNHFYLRHPHDFVVHNRPFVE